MSIEIIIGTKASAYERRTRSIGWMKLITIKEMMMVYEGVDLS
jgi:hypothetical protein